jgi:CBS-domain-containing membrane protein
MPDDEWRSLSREDFEQALEEMGHVVDVSVNDLVELTEKARRHAVLRRKESILVQGLMSQPVHTVTPDTSLADAAETLLTHRISGLPVVDPENRLVGIITEADFLCAVGIPCHHPAASLWQRLEEMFANVRPPIRDPGETVDSVMSKEVVTVGPDMLLHDALETMKAHQVKRLVVVDAQRVPIGMITRSDLVRAFFRRLRWTDLTDDGTGGKP